MGLMALAGAEAAKGSGMLNAAGFLGGTIGVTVAGIAYGIASLGGALAAIAASSVVAAVLCCWAPRGT
ncbi:MAG: hypothetical protein U1F33_13895, partial [Alphaproteobacteria bacterium]